MSVCSGARLNQHSQLNSSNTPTAIELKVVTEVITEADEMDDEALDMQRQMESKHSMQHPDGRGVASHDMA